jgi:hypothetical protein
LDAKSHDLPLSAVRTEYAGFIGGFSAKKKVLRKSNENGRQNAKNASRAKATSGGRCGAASRLIPRVSSVGLASSAESRDTLRLNRQRKDSALRRIKMIYRLFLPVAMAIGCATLPSLEVAEAATYEGKIDEIDIKEYELTIVNRKGEEMDFDVDDDCVVIIDGEDSDFEELEEDSLVKLTTAKKNGTTIIVKIIARSPK